MGLPARRAGFHAGVRLPNQARRVAECIAAYHLAVCLLAQAALLFWRLDLLPVWGDEQFTLDTSARPLATIAAIVRSDIHPPLYYILIHYWMLLPWSAASIVKARAFSGVWALASTIVLRRLWVRDARFFLLWTLSPCLILYGRMARSYTLQLFLALLALYWGMRLVRDPRRRDALAWYAIAGALLLYTHYLPAIAIIFALELLLLYRRAWMSFAVTAAAIALAYAPWLPVMSAALGRVLQSRPYAVTKHPILEQAIRLLYAPVSFTLGESLPLWVIAGGALLAPAVAIVIWRSRQKLPEWFPAVLPAAVIAYAGAARWVSFSFVPARMLFALPFYVMLLARRTWIGVALACLWIGSLYSYFHKENFLNKGYLLPFDEIADVIERRSAGTPARLIVDAPGVDVSPLAARTANLLAAGPDADLTWVLRGRSPIALPYREIWRAGFVRYSSFDHFMMRLLDWETQPEYVLELIEYSRR